MAGAKKARTVSKAGTIADVKKPLHRVAFFPEVLIYWRVMIAITPPMFPVPYFVVASHERNN